MTERIKWVDYSKSFGIFLVVLGHAGLPDNIRSIFYAFHIPLFFFWQVYSLTMTNFPAIFLFFEDVFFNLLYPIYFLISSLIYFGSLSEGIPVKMP